MRPSPDEEDSEEYHGETTIVKGEDYRWQPEDKTDSMSSPSNELLAKINTRILVSPEPEPFDEDTTSYAQLDTQPQQTTPYRRPDRVVTTTMEERLQQMPKLRDLPWRDGVEDGADNETGGESRRKQIRFGCLLSTRGEVQAVPCQSCANGRGKFSVCVALDGFFKGACASCQLSGRPNRCSIKKNSAGEIAGSPTLNPPRPEDLSSPRSIEHQQSLSGISQSAKRRKTDNSVPAWESARPVWEQELGESARQQMNQIVERSSWAPVNVNSPAGMSGPHQMMNGMNGSAPRPQGGNNDRNNSLSWASINQQIPMAGQQFGNGRGGSASGPRINMEQARREGTGLNEEGSSLQPLIDTLPKNAQRQIYGAMSGMQGSIENVQRELNSLKRTLGVDDDDGH